MSKLPEVIVELWAGVNRRYICPGCNARYTLVLETGGRLATCDNCGTKSRMPEDAA